jgi:hypothetical protein
MPINPDSLKGKLLLNVFDKLVLGLIAAIVFFLVQECTRKETDKTNRKRDVSQIYTETVQNAITSIRKEMQTVLVRVEEIEESGDKERTEQIGDIKKAKIIITSDLDLIIAIVPEAGQPGNDLLSSLASLLKYIDSNKGSLDDSTINKKVADIRINYGKMISSFRKALKTIVSKEWGDT